MILRGTPSTLLSIYCSCLLSVSDLVLKSSRRDAEEETHIEKKEFEDYACLHIETYSAATALFANSK
jgi:hypothetical protein